MAPATAQEIEAAVRKLLEEATARDVYHLAGDDYNKTALVESAGVVDKLVDLFVHDKPAGEGGWALRALRYLVQIGQVAQDAIAHAHDGAIFKWLAGPQDHGDASDKNLLISNFTNNHPTNAFILNTARGGDAASLVDFVLKSLQSGDDTNAALVMNFLVCIARGKGETSTIADSSIAVHVSVLCWDPCTTDPTLSTIRDQAVFFLLQHLNVDEAKEALLHPLEGVEVHLTILKRETSEIRSKVLAVLRLDQLANDNESAALEIVSGGGIPVLVDLLRRLEANQLLVNDVRKHVTDLLKSISEISTRVRDEVMKTDAITPLILLYQSTLVSHRTTALDALHAFLRDEKTRCIDRASVGFPTSRRLPANRETS